jgi:hypothetical protein
VTTSTIAIFLAAALLHGNALGLAAATPGEAAATDLGTQRKAATTEASDRSSACEVNRAGQQKKFIQMLKPLNPDFKFSDTYEKNKVDNLATQKCFWTHDKAFEIKYGRPCVGSYQQSVEFMHRADKITADACASLKSVAEKAQACDAGSAACMKGVARDLGDAKVKLESARKLAGKVITVLNGIGQRARTSAGLYVIRLSDIATRLRALPKDGKPLDPSDLELAKKLGLPENEDLTLPSFMMLTGINELKPEKFEAKSVEYRQTMSSGQVNPKDSSPFSQQLGAGLNSSEFVTFARESDARIQAVTGSIDSQITTFNNLSEKYASVGTAPAQPVATRAATGGGASFASAAPTPQSVSTGVDPGSSGRPATASSDSSSASRAQSFSVPAAEIAHSASAMRAPASPAIPSARNRVQASADSAGIERSSFAAISSPGGAVHEAAQAAPTIPAAQSPGNTQPSANVREVTSVVYAATIEQARVAYEVVAPSRPATSPSQPFSATADLGPQLRLETATPVSHETIQSRASAFASSELAKLEMSHPLSSSLRDTLRQRLVRDYSSRATKAQDAATAAQADGSANLVGEVLRKARDDDSWASREDSEQFRMLEADTDREVQKLMGSPSGERLASTAEFDGVTLFSRVHAAYQRRSR